MNMKLSNQGLSSREEFEIYIESIGFKYNPCSYLYVYNGFIIYFKSGYYDLYNGLEMIRYSYNDLTSLENYFKKEFRSIKLKQLLR